MLFYNNMHESGVIMSQCVCRLASLTYLTFSLSLSVCLLISLSLSPPPPPLPPSECWLVNTLRHGIAQINKLLSYLQLNLHNVCSISGYCVSHLPPCYSHLVQALGG